MVSHMSQLSQMSRPGTVLCALTVALAGLAPSAHAQPEPEQPVEPVAPVEEPAPEPPADQQAPEAPPAPPAPPPPAPPPPPPGPPNVASTPDLTDAELEKLAVEAAEVIMVTGSTIERRELTTPSPVSVLDKSDLDAAGVATIGEIIQNLPSQGNGINAQFNNGGDGSTRVDLRGLGSDRTLVLLNGRRVVPGGLGADASVDLNSIPLAVIERVEVLKDGASAVYGSDAIGGVVNIITRNDFNGTEATVYTGGSQRRDGFNYDVSFVTGHATSKGNIMFAAGYQNQQPVFAGDRSFSEYDRNFDYASRTESIGGSTAIGNGLFNAGEIDVDHDGVADSVDLCGADVTFCTQGVDGAMRPFDQPGDLFNYQPDNYLYTPSARYNLFTAGSYKLSAKTRVFFEGSYLNRTSDQQLAPEPFFSYATISGQSIYNRLGAPGDRPDILGFSRRLVEFGPRRSLESIDTFRVVGGVDGRLPETLPIGKNWKWELSFNYGRTNGILTSGGNLILSRLQNALGPSFVDGNGVARCGTPEAEITGCVPMDITGPVGSITKEMRDYVTFTGVSTGFNDQKTLLAQTGGQLAKTPWGGEVALAIGSDARFEQGGFTPDPLTSTGDTTGNASAPTAGSYNVASAFAELSIIPIVDKQYARWVELDLAARAFRYDTFGSGVTWKAGAMYRPFGGLAVRGTYSTAFRAPSVSELFLGKSDGFPSVEDPCDTTPPSAAGETVMLDPAIAERCAAEGVAPDAQFATGQQRAVSGGNANLDAETAKVLTAGIVYEPSFAPGLSFTADYFRIDIDRAIQSLGASVIVSNCYSRGIEDDCAKIHRDPTHSNAIDFIDDPISNVGAIGTSGFDLAVAYDTTHARFGRLRSQLEGQILRRYDLDNSAQVLKGLGNYDLGVYPRLKANLSTAWSKGPAGAGANARFVGGFDECENADCNGGAPSRAVAANLTFDLFGTYTVKSAAGKTTVAAGVNNLTDQKPSLIYDGFAGDSDASTYDFMGRYFYARVTQLF
jgi:iron complex outermembrane recepter protein